MSHSNRISPGHSRGGFLSTDQQPPTTSSAFPHNFANSMQRPRVNYSSSIPPSSSKQDTTFQKLQDSEQSPSPKRMRQNVDQSNEKAIGEYSDSNVEIIENENSILSPQELQDSSLDPFLYEQSPQQPFQAQSDYSNNREIEISDNAPSIPKEILDEEEYLFSTYNLKKEDTSEEIVNKDIRIKYYLVGHYLASQLIHKPREQGDKRMHGNPDADHINHIIRTLIGSAMPSWNKLTIVINEYMKEYLSRKNKNCMRHDILTRMQTAANKKKESHKNRIVDGHEKRDKNKYELLVKTIWEEIRSNRVFLSLPLPKDIPPIPKDEYITVCDFLIDKLTENPNISQAINGRPNDDLLKLMFNALDTLLTETVGSKGNRPTWYTLNDMIECYSQERNFGQTSGRDLMIHVLSVIIKGKMEKNARKRKENTDISFGISKFRSFYRKILTFNRFGKKSTEQGALMTIDNASWHDVSSYPTLIPPIYRPTEETTFKTYEEAYQGNIDYLEPHTSNFTSDINTDMDAIINNIPASDFTIPMGNVAETSTSENNLFSQNTFSPISKNYDTLNNSSPPQETSFPSTLAGGSYMGTALGMSILNMPNSIDPIEWNNPQQIQGGGEYFYDALQARPSTEVWNNKAGSIQEPSILEKAKQVPRDFVQNPSFDKELSNAKKEYAMLPSEIKELEKEVQELRNNLKTKKLKLEEKNRRYAYLQGVNSHQAL